MPEEPTTFRARVRTAMMPVPMNKPPDEPEVDVDGVVGILFAVSWLVAVGLAIELADSLVLRLLIVAAVVGGALGIGWVVSWLRGDR